MISYWLDDRGAPLVPDRSINATEPKPRSSKTWAPSTLEGAAFVTQALVVQVIAGTSPT